eukprot:Skav233232  [mRNA]  locus=scaffold1215:405242:409519:+ [translate_table: standard]
MLRPELWTFSFPCQPWSGSAKQQGFDSDNGKVLVEGLMKARLMRPKTILLENVQNFMEHDHHPTFMKLVAFAGYRFLHQGIHDAQERLPCRRPRYLAILERVEETPHEFHWDGWGNSNQSAPSVWDAYIYSGNEELRAFAPTKDELQMYLDPAYLPPSAPLAARSNMMKYRVPPASQKTPVCMANYGNHHNLPPSLLTEKGMMGYFTIERSTIRWYKPLEQALLHCQVQDVVMLEPAKFSWHAVGNQIVFHHAYSALWNALKHIFATPEQATLRKHIDLAEQTRLKASTATISYDGYAWYCAHRDVKPHKMIVQRMIEGMGWDGSPSPSWPDNTYFDPMTGAMSIEVTFIPDLQKQVVISPTLPMFPEEVVTFAPEALESFAHHHPATQHGACSSDGVSEAPPADMPLQDHSIARAFPTDAAALAQRLHTEDNVSLRSEPVVAKTAIEDASEDSVHLISSQEATQCPAFAPEDGDTDMHDTPISIMPFLIPGTYGTLTVARSMTVDDLISLWDYHVLPCTLLNFSPLLEPAMEAFVMGPAQPGWLVPMRCVDEHQVFRPSDRYPSLLIYDQSHLAHVATVSDQPWRALCKHIDYHTDKVYDEYGQVPLDHVFNHNTRIFDHFPPVPMMDSATEVAMALNKINVTVRVPLDTDVLVCKLEGESEALIIAATLWHIALDMPWQQMHHRRLAFQAISSTEVQFLFRPAGTGFATPTSLFKHMVSTRLYQTILASLHQPASNHVFQVKYYHRIVIEITTDALTPQVLLAISRHAYGMHYDNAQPSTLIRGKRITEAIDIYAAWCQPKHANQPRKLHLIMPMTGGVGSKSEHKQFLHTELASLLMEHGMPVKDVPTCIDQILKQVGMPKVTSIVCNLTGDERFNAVKTICDQLHVHWPVQSIQRAQRKFQKITQHKQIREARNVDPTQYRLMPGYFQLQDHTPAQIFHDIAPGRVGLSMVTPQQAEPWVGSGTKITPDEMGLFILGPMPDTQLRAERVTAPATNLQGDTCLLAGWLVQLGEKDICTDSALQPTVQTNDVQKCAFTMWSCDHDEETWTQITQMPVRCAKKILDRDGHAEHLLTPYGRTFRANNESVPPAQAQSVQFHAEVKIAALRPMLRRSGFNKLYLTPKDETGRASTSWRVIWMALPREAIEVRAAAFPAAAGLVKGQQKLGLRVESKHFTEIWNHFFPGQEPPVLPTTGQTWKVHPLPCGVDKTVLTEWAAKYQWPIVPTRPLGRSAWLFTAEDPPKKQTMFFNGTPVILKKLEAPGPMQPIGLIAGPRSKAAQPPVVQASPKETNPFRTGDPHYDPWRPTQAADAKQSLAGPTATQLDQHAQQLKDLETAVSQIKQSQMEQAQASSERFQTLENTVAKQYADTQQAFIGFRDDFEKTLTKALTDQDSRINDTMKELKQLLTRKDKRKTADSGDDSM